MGTGGPGKLWLSPARNEIRQLQGEYRVFQAEERASSKDLRPETSWRVAGATLWRSCWATYESREEPKASSQGNSHCKAKSDFILRMLLCKAHS